MFVNRTALLIVHKQTKKVFLGLCLYDYSMVQNRNHETPYHKIYICSDNKFDARGKFSLGRWINNTSINHFCVTISLSSHWWIINCSFTNHRCFAALMIHYLEAFKLIHWQFSRGCSFFSYQSSRSSCLWYSWTAGSRFWKRKHDFVSLARYEMHVESSYD